VNASFYIDNLDYMYHAWNGSVNLYLVHGGTNFAFMNGGKASPDGPVYNENLIFKQEKSIFRLLLRIG
jgi:hypothetical protein